MAKLATSQLIGANFSFQHHPFDHWAARMRDFGFDRIELWGIAPHLDIGRLTDEGLTRRRKVLEDNGLGVRCVTPEQVAYPVNIASGDDSYRDASIAQFLRAAEIAAELAADYLFLTPGRGYESEPEDRAWERSAEALTRIVSRAAELGIRCLLEPLQRAESNIVTDAAGLERMLDMIPAQTVDVVLDTVAMSVAGDNVQDYLARFGERLAHVHLVDGTPAGHLVWGDGYLPLGELVTDLAAGGYAGTLTFEPMGNPAYALDPVLVWQRNMSAIAPFLDGRGRAA